MDNLGELAARVAAGHLKQRVGPDARALPFAAKLQIALAAQLTCRLPPPNSRIVANKSWGTLLEPCITKWVLGRR